MPRDTDLLEAVGRLLEHRPGWGYEPSPTPGATPSWCYHERGHIVLSVSVAQGTICAYLPDGDLEVQFPDVDALMAWVSLAGWTMLLP